MKKYFPKLNLTKVEFCINSTLPGNWFQSRDKVAAMTFGYRIYFNRSDIQKTRSGLKLLMHELVHVDQVRRKGGEIPFACDYGKGYLRAGSYRQNPMEVEAYDFVARHGELLPNGVPKTGVVTHYHSLPVCKPGRHHSSCTGKKAEVSCVPLMGKCLCIHHK
jgi:hypothetical protein